MLQMNATCHPASVGVSPPRVSAQAERGNQPSSAILKQLCSVCAAPSWLIRGSVPFLLSLQGHWIADFKRRGTCHSSRIFTSLQLQAVAICVGEGGKKNSNGFLQWVNFFKLVSFESKWLGERDNGQRTGSAPRYMTGTCPTQPSSLSHGYHFHMKKSELNNLFFWSFPI